MCLCCRGNRLLKEMVCSLITCLLAMPLGILQFIPVYHGLHDGFQIHSEICVLLFLMLFFLTAWSSDRRPSAQARTATLSGIWLTILTRSIWKMLGPFATASRFTLPFTRCRYCRTLPLSHAACASMSTQRRQRQCVTERTAMAP